MERRSEMAERAGGGVAIEAPNAWGPKKLRVLDSPLKTVT
jgi:hypothetical protein